VFFPARKGRCLCIHTDARDQMRKVSVLEKRKREIICNAISVFALSSVFDMDDTRDGRIN